MEEKEIFDRVRKIVVAQLGVAPDSVTRLRTLRKTSVLTTGTGVGKLAMLGKRKEAKAKRSILESLLRDMQGTPAQKLAMFERLKAAGAFVNESAAELGEAEKTLRSFAAMEKGGG